MKKEQIYRFIVYCIGLLILAFGIILNTKTGLGVSPIISVAYSISYVFHLNFGNTTLVLYSLFVAAQFAIRGKDAKKKDVLQILLAVIFTRFMNLFSAVIPETAPILWQQILLLILAVVLTGIGISMSVNMRLIPNPGDGIVQAIADKSQKEMGLVKNLFDLGNITVTFCIGLISGNLFLGIGLGTVLAVLGVGRSVACFNHFFKPAMDRLLSQAACQDFYCRKDSKKEKNMI